MEQQKLILFVRNRQVLSNVLNQVSKDLIVASLNFETLEKNPSNLLPPEVLIDEIEQYSRGGGKSNYCP